jgi:hypothetical protein
MWYLNAKCSWFKGTAYEQFLWVKYVMQSKYESSFMPCYIFASEVMEPLMNWSFQLDSGDTYSDGSCGMWRLSIMRKLNPKLSYK